MTKKIENLRFTYDNRDEYRNLLIKAKTLPEEKMFHLSSSLKINSMVTPSLFEVVSQIEKNLNIKSGNIEYFISRDLEMNASCFSLNNGEDLIVILNSGLINRMNCDELSFVIGHEIGHYLLGHLNEREIKKEKILMKYNHAKEISADRIGLICTNSIESAIRAMVKLISGLDDKFLSNNFTQFTRQHNQLEKREANIYSYTHPTLPTRAKALKLFSMSEPYYQWKTLKDKAPISTTKLNKIKKEYNKITKKEKDDFMEMIKDIFLVYGKKYKNKEILDKLLKS